MKKFLLIIAAVVCMTVISTSNVVDRKLQSYKTDDVEQKYLLYALFMKDVCNVDLFPTQLMQADDYFHHNYTLEVKPPRAAKSFGKAGINLYECSTNPYENLTIYTPKFSIGKEAYAYQYNFIDHSEILSRFVRVKNGKKQLRSIGYELQNESN